MKKTVKTKKVKPLSAEAGIPQPKNVSGGNVPECDYNHVKACEPNHKLNGLGFSLTTPTAFLQYNGVDATCTNNHKKVVDVHYSFLEKKNRKGQLDSVAWVFHLDGIGDIQIIADAKTVDHLIGDPEEGGNHD